MENNATNIQNYQRTSKKIGKHLRATHYKLGADGKQLYIISNYIFFNK